MIGIRSDKSVLKKYERICLRPVQKPHIFPVSNYLVILSCQFSYFHGHMSAFLQTPDHLIRIPGSDEQAPSGAHGIGINAEKISDLNGFLQYGDLLQINIQSAPCFLG